MISLGTFLLKTGQSDKAMKVFNSVMKLDKKNTDIAIAYGNIYLELDSLDKASSTFQKQRRSMRTCRRSTLVWRRRTEGRISTSSQFRTTKSCRVGLDLSAVHYKLGKAFYKGRLYNDCAISLKTAVNLDPNNDVYVFDVADLFYRAKQ